MDLDHIDMAMKAYLPKLSESEQERLRFFRTLWGVQAEMQKEHAGKVGRALMGMPISRIRCIARCAVARRPWPMSARRARRPRVAVARCGERNAVASGISSACAAPVAVRRTRAICISSTSRATMITALPRAMSAEAMCEPSIKRMVPWRSCIRSATRSRTWSWRSWT